MNIKKLLPLLAGDTREMIARDLLDSAYPNLRRAQEAIEALNTVADHTQYVATERDGSYLIVEVASDETEIGEPEQETISLSGTASTKTQAKKK